MIYYTSGEILKALWLSGEYKKLIALKEWFVIVSTKVRSSLNQERSASIYEASSGCKVHVDQIMVLSWSLSNPKQYSATFFNFSDGCEIHRFTAFPGRHVTTWGLRAVTYEVELTLIYSVHWSMHLSFMFVLHGYSELMLVSAWAPFFYEWKFW